MANLEADLIGAQKEAKLTKANSGIFTGSGENSIQNNLNMANKLVGSLTMEISKKNEEIESLKKKLQGY